VVSISSKQTNPYNSCVKSAQAEVDARQVDYEQHTAKAEQCKENAQKAYEIKCKSLKEMRKLIFSVGGEENLCGKSLSDYKKLLGAYNKSNKIYGFNSGMFNFYNNCALSDCCNKMNWLGQLGVAQTLSDNYNKNMSIFTMRQSMS